MKTRTNQWAVPGSLLLVVAFSAGRRSGAQEAQSPYPNRAPVDQYLMPDRNAEIALARSAAPESISRDAKVMILGRHGYETAGEGKNGFVCLVERGWTAQFDQPEFWNPKIRGPNCFNPAAARSVVPLIVRRSELVMKGMSKPEMIDGIKSALEKREFPVLEPGAMCFMTSKLQNLGDAGGHWRPHLMFYVPKTEPGSWGSDLPGSPVLRLPMFDGAPEPITVFMVPVGKWSDGSPAAAEHH